MPTFFYADDGAIICKDRLTLIKVIEILQQWSEKYRMVINKEKSAIMKFRRYTKSL